MITFLITMLSIGNINIDRGYQERCIFFLMLDDDDDDDDDDDPDPVFSAGVTFAGTPPELRRARRSS